MKARKIRTVIDWIDDLIWCPSQCEYCFSYNGFYFMLYLRWRHSDPWTATLIHCPNKKFDIHSDYSVWIELNIPDFKDTDDLIEIKKSALTESEKQIKANKNWN